MRMILILNRVFAAEFYKLNSAFFLLVIGLSFGFMSGVEHKALALFFVASPTLLLVPISCWFLYMLKIIQFNKRILYLPPNEFIFNLLKLHKTFQWLYMVPVLLNQLAPAIAYAIFLMIVAIQNTLITPVIHLTVILFALTAISTFAFIYILNHLNPEKKGGIIKSFFDTNFTKPYFQFFILWITRRDLATLIGTKLFSCLFLWGVISLYSSDAYDSRLLAMGAAVAFSGNVMLVYHLHQFENLHFQILRNLPIPLWKRLLYFILTFTLICLPDLGLLTNNFPSTLGFSAEIFIVVFGLSIVILHYTYLYQRNMLLDRFIQHVFGITLFFVVMILFSVPVWCIAFINLIVATILFRKYYYGFELVTNSKHK